MAGIMRGIRNPDRDKCYEYGSAKVAKVPSRIGKKVNVFKARVKSESSECNNGSH